MRTQMERLWEFTQNPTMHQRWDLRFTTIHYLPKTDSASPQRFRYETRVGFGLSVAGEGESTGTRSGASGECTSALKFWSDDSKSLIRAGAGYWKYIPARDEIRFLTWYDYQPRFGLLGRAFDAILFRPLMGWATAWSFDRLRLWLEHDFAPELVLRSSLVYGVCRGLIAFVWIWHGLVPKLLFHDAGELAMLSDAGVAARWLPLIGFAEIGLGVLGLLAWRWRGYFLFTGVAMVTALCGVALSSPAQLSAAFNPVTLNLAVAGLCLCGWLSHRGAAFAGRCLRRPRATEDREVSDAVHL